MIGIGIIGAGHFGAVHARALAGLPDARLVASCRTDLAGAERFAAEHGGAAHADWRALLDDPAVEVVLVATPHDRHVEAAVAALDSGRHVLVEKPLAATVEGCDAILGAAERASGRLMVGHLPRFLAPMQVAAETLAAGGLGRPVAGSATFVKLWMEGNRQAWHLDPASGGGMLMTAGIHALDRLLFLMGAEVAAVSAMMGAAFHDQKADDTAFLNLRLTDGRMAQVASLGTRDAAVTSALWIACEGGTLALDEAGLRVGQEGRWRDLPVPAEAEAMEGALRRQWRAFLDAIATGSAAPVSGAYARHLVAVIEAARRADAERREIAVVGVSA